MLVNANVVNWAVKKGARARVARATVAKVTCVGEQTGAWDRTGAASELLLYDAAANTKRREFHIFLPS